MKTKLISWEEKKKATKNPSPSMFGQLFLFYFFISQQQYNQLACAFPSASPALADQQVKGAEGSSNYFY